MFGPPISARLSTIVAYARDKNSGHTVAAYMGPIPAGATVSRDTSYPSAEATRHRAANSDIPSGLALELSGRIVI
jgi:hypothetical protein